MRLATGCSEGFVRIVNAETGTVEHKIDFGESGVYGVAYSPCGTKLGMCSNNQISVIDATHGDVERVAYPALACIAGCGDVSAAKKLGSS